MANQECITAVESAERNLWGYVSEAQSYLAFAHQIDACSLTQGLLERLCEGVENFTLELARVKHALPDSVTAENPLDPVLSGVV